MRSKTLSTLKQELKLAAELIRCKKPLLRKAHSNWFKNNCLGGKPELHFPLLKNMNLLEHQVSALQYDFRHKHIAYCLLRGKKMEQIESKRRPCTSKTCERFTSCCNKPHQAKIDELLAYYGPLVVAEITCEGMKGAVDEALRIG